MKQPTVFFGASVYVLPIIGLLKRDYDLKLVITTEINPQDAVPAYCNKNNIPFVSLTSFKSKPWEETRDKIMSWNISFAVLAHFGLIIPQSVLDMFPKGIINIHPSRLPQYRGATPGQTAILLGDVRSGVSIMLLDNEQDHGPLLGQIAEEISATDTSQTLYKRLFDKSIVLLEKTLRAYLSDTLQPVEQKHSNATDTKLLTRNAGYFDSKKGVSPTLLDRMIRAYYPWPGVWTKWDANGKEKVVKFLPGEQIQVEGKKPMNYADFMNGYPEGKAFLEKLQLI